MNVAIALLLAGCGSAPEPASAGRSGTPPGEATATDVVIEGDGWGAAAARLRFGSATAHAEEVAVVDAAGGGLPLSITAARSDWDLRARIAHFEGDVVVTRGEVEIRCARLEVRYADAERIDRVLAEGGVEVRRGDRRARSGRADLDGTTGRILLTGDPRLSEGPNTLVGERITLYLDDERATCEGAEGGAPCRLAVDGSALP